MPAWARALIEVAVASALPVVAARRRRPTRPLTPERRERYAAEWQSTQAAFADEPVEAVANADRLVSQVMAERRCSAGHAETVESYRVARTVAAASTQGGATTEQLRRVMQLYRALFDELLEPTPW